MSRYLYYFRVPTRKSTYTCFKYDSKLSTIPFTQLARHIHTYHVLHVTNYWPHRRATEGAMLGTLSKHTHDKHSHYVIKS